MKVDFDGLRKSLAEMYNELYNCATTNEDTEILDILKTYRIYMGMLLLCESNEPENFKSLLKEAETLKGGEQ